MRLIEEKQLVAAELVLLAAVVMLGAVIQILTHKIEHENAALIKSISELNLTENERHGQEIKSLKYLFAAFADANVEVDFDKAIEDSGLGSGFKIIIGEYQDGEISKLEYFNKLSALHDQIGYAIYEKYGAQKREMERLQNSKNSLPHIRSFLYSIQVLVVLLAMGIYMYIFRSISSRINY